MASDLFACPHCPRTFADENGRYCHVKAKHGRRLARPLRLRVEREPSMGSLVAEAELARACGEPVDDWISEMFGV